MRGPHFLFQPQPPGPKRRFHHLVINILGKRRASGNNYAIMYGGKCTLCPHKNTQMHEHIYISMIGSSSLPRSGYSHARNTAAVDVMNVLDGGQILHLKYFNFVFCIPTEFLPSSMFLNFCEILVCLLFCSNKSPTGFNGFVEDDALTKRDAFSLSVCFWTCLYQTRSRFNQVCTTPA